MQGNCNGPINGRPQSEVHVERDKLEVVASLCNLDDMLSPAKAVKFGLLLTSVKMLWKKFRELLRDYLSYKTCGHVYSSCMLRTMLHIGEIWMLHDQAEPNPFF